MGVLTRAPFFAVLAGLVTALALSERAAFGAAPFWALPLTAFLAALGVMLSSYGEDLKGQWKIAAFTLALTLSLTAWIVFSLDRKPFIAASGAVDTEGIVVECRPWGRFYAAAVKTPQGNFVLTLPFESLVEGDRIRLLGMPKPFRGAASGGGFREDYFWWARGMTARLAPAKTEPLPSQEPTRGFAGVTSDFISLSFHRWRHALYRSLVLYAPRLTGAYLNAVWTGKRDTSLSAFHRAAGTSHLLAVSGFHVGLVMGCASLAFKRGKGRVLWLSLLLWFYISLTGMPASAARAGLMIQIALLGELFGRPGGALNSVSLAAALLLLNSPFWFWDVGWRLSVLAALMIAALLEFSDPRGWKTWISLSLSLWIVTLPQASRTFGAVPLAGIVINLAAPPFFGFALSASSAFALLRLLNLPVLNSVADACLYAAEGGFLFWEAAAGAVIRAIPWQVEWNSVLALCCAVVSIGILCRAFFIRGRVILLLAPLGACAMYALFAT
jgi:competence protein ComEC